jgi:hypothetical protein
MERWTDLDGGWSVDVRENGGLFTVVAAVRWIGGGENTASERFEPPEDVASHRCATREEAITVAKHWIARFEAAAGEAG